MDKGATLQKPGFVNEKAESEIDLQNKLSLNRYIETQLLKI